MRTFGSMLKRLHKESEDKVKGDLDNFINVLLARSSAKNSSMETDHFIGSDVLSLACLLNFCAFFKRLVLVVWAQAAWLSLV